MDSGLSSLNFTFSSSLYCFQSLLLVLLSYFVLNSSFCCQTLTLLPFLVYYYYFNWFCWFILWCTCWSWHFKSFKIYFLTSSFLILPLPSAYWCLYDALLLILMKFVLLSIGMLQDCYHFHFLHFLTTLLDHFFV